MSRYNHGFGILSWLNDLPLTRFLRILEPYAVVLAIAGLLSQCDDMKTERDARAWEVITTPASGNSGKIEALEYLNSHYPLAVPNPRQWGIPLGPPARIDGKVPESWILIGDWGWWKTRTPLEGIDLSRNHAPDGGWSAGVYLVGIDLSEADLLESNFSGAAMSGAKLSRANLTHARLSETDLRNANLSHADLTAADLSGANLAGANLTGVNLGALVKSPNKNSQKVIAAADLSRADLRYANFAKAHLILANLWGADLRGAKLADARDVAQLQINETCTDEATTLPKGIRHPAPCQINTLLGNIIRDETGAPLRVK